MVAVYVKFILLITAGISFMVYGLRKYLLFKKISKEGNTVDGAISKYDRIIDHDPDFTQIYYRPVFTFKNENGDEITAANELVTFKKFKKNILKINYLKLDNKYHVIIDAPFWKIYLPLTYFSFGIILLIFSTIVFP